MRRDGGGESRCAAGPEAGAAPQLSSSRVSSKPGRNSSIKQRRAGSGYGAPRQSYYGTTSNGYSSADPTMQQIRLAIARGDISQAERLLNAVSDHNAEWSFLMGNVCYRRGWLDEAKRYFETACRMDPENPEYRQALAAFNNRGYRPQGYQTVSTSCGNDACSNWCLATLCCNLLGGGGYFCLPCMF